LRFKNNIKSIAIGSFDGLHIAHMKLVDQVEALVIIERNGGYLTPGFKRSLYTSKECYFYHFDKIRALTAKQFVEKLKMDFPNLEHIVVGYDFAFGKEKMGNANSLKELFSGNVSIVNEVTYENISVHSRIIKQFIKDGNIQMVNNLFGRKYQIDGKVIKGQGLGKKEFVPTINLKGTEYALPHDGVYATRTKIENKWYKSVTFLGYRETTDGSFAVETHLLYDNVEVQSGTVWIEFDSFIRKNEKFSSFEELKEQIVIDINKAKIILA
jgi:riboflavin kinase/FMN adenylyltransferase